jgi:hypothetical protein
MWTLNKKRERESRGLGVSRFQIINNYSKNKMNKRLGCILLSAAIGVSGCTFNVGTGGNTANTAATNAGPSAPAANTTTVAANAARSPDATKPTASGSDDPTSETEQIRFAKGQTDSTLDRTIAPGVNKMYMFNAKKGQHVWFKVTEGTGQLEVDFNKNPVKLGEEVKQMLNASGDWAIYISNPSNKPLNYNLWIGIE